MQDWLTQFPVAIDIPVAWGEMDAKGHVNHIIYSHHLESTRIAYFLKLGFLAADDLVPVG